MLTQARHIAREFGLDPKRAMNGIRGIGTHFRNRREFMRQANASKTSEFVIGASYPCLADRYADSGVANGHYFHQDLLVAQMIQRASPKRHIDVGSRVDG